jgi:FMN reductase
VAIVNGAVTRPGRLHAALERVAQQASAEGVAVDSINLGEKRIAFADGRPPAELGDDTAAVVDSLLAVDAACFASPVYRGSLTGALKNLLDQLPVAALEGKPVSLFAIGASQHHYLGVERHLRDILAFFGALVLPTGVYLTGDDFEEGTPTPAATSTIDEATATLVAVTRGLSDVDLRPRPLAARAIA